MTCFNKSDPSAAGDRHLPWTSRSPPGEGLLPLSLPSTLFRVVLRHLAPVPFPQSASLSSLSWALSEDNTAQHLSRTGFLSAPPECQACPLKEHCPHTALWLEPGTLHKPGAFSAFRVLHTFPQRPPQGPQHPLPQSHPIQQLGFIYSVAVEFIQHKTNDLEEHHSAASGPSHSGLPTPLRACVLSHFCRV